ncbi:hypothetical protein CC78DRAFT_538489 [Lojkania enalia]|uniref:Uncharacterized protein n=1 Tax=Lojkania enalia TaxID=147567 RepID=A0A9P4JV50_9PLEO|nr:hypothetical protein CC78DRAFT_538489 [Didymosphaeria enalia]
MLWSPDVPGNDGNINADGTVPKKLKVRRGLMRRSAQNVNMDFPFEIRVPANVTCEGVVMGIEAVCFMKIANSNSAGPFGGVIAFQMADAPSVNGTGVGMTFRM